MHMSRYYIHVHIYHVPWHVEHFESCSRKMSRGLNKVTNERSCLLQVLPWAFVVLRQNINWNHGRDGVLENSLV